MPGFRSALTSPNSNGKITSCQHLPHADYSMDTVHSQAKHSESESYSMSSISSMPGAPDAQAADTHIEAGAYSIPSHTPQEQVFDALNVEHFDTAAQ